MAFYATLKYSDCERSVFVLDNKFKIYLFVRIRFCCYSLYSVYGVSAINRATLCPAHNVNVICSVIPFIIAFNVYEL